VSGLFLDIQSQMRIIMCPESHRFLYASANVNRLVVNCTFMHLKPL